MNYTYEPDVGSAEEGKLEEDGKLEGWLVFSRILFEGTKKNAKGENWRKLRIW